MKRKNKKSKAVEIEVGSGNVFADLGFKDPEEHQAKASLAREVITLIRLAELTQAQAARRLGIDQPNVSRLMRGIIRDFSIERLIRFLNLLDREVVLTVRPVREGQHAGLVTHMA